MSVAPDGPGNGALDLAPRYAAAFSAYLRDRGEQGLGAAYDLGREAVAAHLSVLDLAEAHHRALTIDEATVHEVDAFVEWPRHGRVRTRYQRMLLPFTCAAGVRWVLSTSTPGKGIDLRAKA